MSLLVAMVLAGCTAPSSDLSPTEMCEEDVSAAQEAAEGQVCTQQIMEMSCPDDESFTYNAKNGCEISALEERGWTPTG
ncbi:MAG: hypothetical protein SVV03_01930 [Candidatus Nanohaloarchaea archaeon]|nr:hypothetical protein [Candidatus Nanohaloarchaea archaeon]